MIEQPFTRLPGETETEARQRLAIMRGEALKTQEDRINEEKERTDVLLNHLKTW